MTVSRDTLQVLLQRASTGGGEPETLNQLTEAESVPGFYAELLSIAAAPGAPLDAKFAAAAYFKSVVSRRWRSAESPIPLDVRADIRAAILDAALDPNPLVAAQLTAALSTIARVDYPTQWPDLFNDILARIAAAQYPSTQLERLWSCLLQCLKAVINARFGRRKTAIAAQADQVLSVCVEAYRNYISKYLQTREDSLLLAHLSLKCACKLVVSCVDNLPNSEHTCIMFSEMSNALPQLFQIRSTDIGSILLAKHIQRIGKCYLAIIEAKPYSFVLMPRAPDIIRSYISLADSKADIFRLNPTEVTPEMDADFWKAVSLQALKLFRSLALFIVKREGGLAVRSAADNKHEQFKLAFQIAKNDILTIEYVDYLSNLLLTKFFPLTPTHLEQWQDDPEQWIYDETQASWEYDLRHCAENIFHVMLSAFTDHMVPQLAQFIEQSDNIDNIMDRDAIYAALGAGATFLHEYIDFDRFVKNSFIPILQGTDPSFRILRHRICWVISQWVTVQCNDRDAVYKILQQTIDPSNELNDIVVRFSAVVALRYCVDDWEFEADTFVPYILFFLDRLMSMLCSELEMVETKLYVLQVAAILIRSCGSKVQERLDQVLAVLPPLWRDSGDEQLMKVAVLQTLTHLADNLSDIPPSLYEVSFAFLWDSIQRDNPDYIYLIDDALLLWSRLLTNSAKPDEKINAFGPMAVALLETPPEDVELLLGIIEQHLLIDGFELCKNCGVQLMKNLITQLPNVSINSGVEICNILCTMELLFEGENLRALFSVQTSTKSMGIVDALVEDILHEKVKYALLEVKSLLVFAHLVIKDAEFGIGLLKVAVERQSRTMNDLVREWVDRFSSIIVLSEKKLNAMCMVAILAHGAIDSTLANEILSLAAQMIEEVHEVNGDSQAYYSSETPLNEGDRRRLSLLETGPAHKIPMKGFVKGCALHLLNENRLQDVYAVLDEANQALLERMLNE
ncbi:hypothetical protein CANCADRAFT_124414 [Tortispora caseinolytica NRRL Y-17796]|uniref:Importin N-terminal domain-containing protein n=1 Tax=Tortispora caseinolytica NRRL Y-17796 TaxID=767744 RepID=A0A1E4TA18_9ASCO|nr:hypothetical protein CANCADRAFT_124414 [Tortispora caseinolytica NRRL Y-17796]